ncbi:MAG: MBL fold metallo-hydrolase [Gammaproteobacteria bacterium]|nr:MBL fold metallo-hydrolase [Gammaproteobacteria bacterium]
MRFASLGSGSRGNATLVASGSTHVLIDCGFSARETTRRLGRLGVDPARLDAILVTHEHGDHLSGVARIARAYALPVWMTAGTRAAWRDGALPTLGLLEPGRSLAVGDLAIHPYPVPHDACEPCQFVLDDGARRLGLLTDAGHVDGSVLDGLEGCQGLLLECNHDPELLAASRYPPGVRMRIAGDSGHLSNAQAADCLARLDTGGLQQVAAAHLSVETNTPGCARQALAGALGCAPRWIDVADQTTGLGWRELR